MLFKVIFIGLMLHYQFGKYANITGNAKDKFAARLPRSGKSWIGRMKLGLRPSGNYWIMKTWWFAPDSPEKGHFGNVNIVF